MNNNHLKSIIQEALKSCITGKGIAMVEKFDNLELEDFANTVVSYIKDNSVSEIVYNTRDTLETNDFVNDSYISKEEKDIKDCIALFYKNELKELGFIRLIFNLISRYQLISDIPFEKAIKEYQNYLFSYIIPDLHTLYFEIEENKINGRTLKIDRGYLRLNNKDNTYIPTTKTIKHYNKYLKL